MFHSVFQSTVSVFHQGRVCVGVRARVGVGLGLGIRFRVRIGLGFRVRIGSLPCEGEPTETVLNCMRGPAFCVLSAPQRVGIGGWWHSGATSVSWRSIDTVEHRRGGLKTRLTLDMVD